MYHLLLITSKCGFGIAEKLLVLLQMEKLKGEKPQMMDGKRRMRPSLRYGVAVFFMKCLVAHISCSTINFCWINLSVGYYRLVMEGMGVAWCSKVSPGVNELYLLPMRSYCSLVMT